MSDPADLADVEHPHVRRTLKVLLVIVAIAASTVAGLGWLGARMDAQAAQVVAPVERQVQDHENRLRAVERTQEEIRGDVRWIRSTLERRAR